MRIERFRRACVAIVSVTLVSMGAQLPAAASVVTTSDALAASRGDARAVIDATLGRADVQRQLAAMGVEPTAIQGRLAALSDEEVAGLADRIADAPAGGDALAVIGVLFLVLIILEVVGVIDIFKKA